MRGALALGATGSAAVVGLGVAAFGAAVAGGLAADTEVAKDSTAAADKLGDDFYKVLLQEEPFQSTTLTPAWVPHHVYAILCWVKSILTSYRRAPFVPVSTESSILSVLLLLSKYRLRNVPVIEPGNPIIKNFITQSAVVQGLRGCSDRDWFDLISSRPFSDLGLPFMSANEIINIQSNEHVLEAFKRMRDHHVGGLPVVYRENKKIVGNVRISDIRHLLLKPDFFSNFRELTVKDFMETVAGTTKDGRVVPPITCKLDSAVGEVIHHIASKAVHRIYVVGEDSEVVGPSLLETSSFVSYLNLPSPNYLDEYFQFVEEMSAKP